MSGLFALAALVRKELVQTFRDRRLAALIVVVPLIQLTIFGYAVNLDVKNTKLVTADEDATWASRRLLDDLAAGDTFREIDRLGSGRQAANALEESRADVVVVVPRGLGRRLGKGSAATLQVLVDGGQSVTAVTAGNAAAQYAGERTQSLLVEALRRRAAASGRAISLPELHFEPRVFYNPSLESRIYMVPGVAASLLLILTTILTAMGIVREKENGTLEQLLVSPVSKLTLLLGKTLPYVLVGFADLLLVLTAAVWIFQVPFRGPVLAVLTGGLLYLGSTLALGLFVSTLAQNQQQATLAALFVIMPGIVLSGFIAPVANMPRWLQVVTMADPMRHFVEILRAGLLKGAGWSDLAPQLLALAALAVLLMAAAVLRFRKRLG